MRNPVSRRTFLRGTVSAALAAPLMLGGPRTATAALEGRYPQRVARLMKRVIGLLFPGYLSLTWSFARGVSSTSSLCNHLVILPLVPSLAGMRSEVRDVVPCKILFSMRYKKSVYRYRCFW